MPTTKVVGDRSSLNSSRIPHVTSHQISRIVVRAWSSLIMPRNTGFESVPVSLYQDHCTRIIRVLLTRDPSLYLHPVILSSYPPSSEYTFPQSHLSCRLLFQHCSLPPCFALHCIALPCQILPIHFPVCSLPRFLQSPELRCCYVRAAIRLGRMDHSVSGTELRQRCKWQGRCMYQVGPESLPCFSHVLVMFYSPPFPYGIAPPMAQGIGYRV